MIMSPRPFSRSRRKQVKLFSPGFSGEHWIASTRQSSLIASSPPKLDGYTVWNEHNTVFGSKRSAICAQAVYGLHSTMPSVTCLRLSDVSVICRVTLFQFSNQSAFYLSVSQVAQRRTWFSQYRTSDVVENLVSCTERTAQGIDFTLILTVKW